MWFRGPLPPRTFTAAFQKVRFVSKSETLCNTRWTIKLA